MGVVGKLKGIRTAKQGVAPIPPEELKQRLLALNHDELPFVLTAGPGGADGDVVAEWKIVDASWYEIFAKASLKKAHKIYVTLDLRRGEARILEEAWEVHWRLGVPEMSLSAKAFRGRTIIAKSYGKAWAFKSVNPLDFGQVYHYTFDVSEMKNPVAEVVTGAGWTFRPVVRKARLAG